MSNEENNNKLDVNAILGNIKKILPQNLQQHMGGTREVTSDALSQKLQDLSGKAQQAAKAHADITQLLYEIEHGINELDADIASVKAAMAEKLQDNDESAE